MTSIQGLGGGAALMAAATAPAGASSTATKNSSDGPVGTVGTQETAKSAGSTDLLGGLGSDTFLKLLVAQMKYQDPSSPADSTQMLAQTAQYAVVEKLTALTALDQKVVDASKSQSAAALLGKTVTWKDVSGNAHTGVVSATSWGAQTPNLTVGDSTFSLDDVTNVAVTPTAAAAATG